MKSKSLFYTILKSSLMMMLLPLLTTIFLYVWAEDMMKDHIQDSSDKTLSQFFMLVDKDVGNFRDTCVALGENRELQKYASYSITEPQKLGYQAVLVKQKLNESYSAKLEEILVYYPHADRIISGLYGTATTDEYFASYYGQVEDYRDCFRDLLACESKQPVLVCVRTNENENLLCVVMRKRFLGDPQQDFVIALILDKEYLPNILQRNQLRTDGALMIFDKDRKLLVSSDDADYYHMDSYNGTLSLYELETKNGIYIMQIMAAESVQGYYAYATDPANYWGELQAVRIWCIVIVLACILVDVVIAFLGTGKVFKPVKGVVKKMEKVGFPAYNQLEYSEMEFIERILELSTEREKVRNKGQNDAELKRNHFVYSILRGEKRPQKEELERLGLTEYTDRYMVVLFFVQRENDMDAQMQSFVLKNVFEEIANVGGWGILIDQGRNQYVMLMNFAENVAAKYRLEELQECQKHISQQLGVKFIMATGNECHGLAGIPHSYEEASLAMKYQYLLTNSGLIQYDHIKDRGFSYFPHLESTLSQKIINYIGDQTEKITEEMFVAEIIHMCGISQESSMESIECFKYEMLSALNKAYLISGDTEKQKKNLKILMTQPNWELFCAELIRILKHLGHTETCGNRQDKICMQCMRYIQEHYGDASLSIAALGEEFQMSPYYVSQLFKGKYGISVPDYITKIRIEHAKADLVSSAKSVKDIAEENGFVNSNVFIRNFKRYEGITPGEYRKGKG